MIAFLKNLFLKDVWLKLFSLALAILIRIVVSFAIEREATSIPILPPPHPEHTFRSVPVSLLTGPDETRTFRIEPKDVEVTVEGEIKLLQTLETRDVRAIINLSGIEGTNPVTRPVEILTPAAITHYRVQPRDVRITPVPKPPG
jgi:YbbR domain-containing protein